MDLKRSWRPNTTRYTADYILGNTDEYCFAVDTETTGLDPEVDKIIEIGIVKLKIENGVFVPVDTLDVYINPEHNLDAKIVKITGITDELLADKPTEKEAFPMIYEFLGANPIFIAYNSHFDVQMVTSMYKRQGVEFEPTCELDVLAMARDLIPGKMTKNGRFNLSTIAEALHIVTDDTHFHLAIDDIKVTVDVLNALIPKYNEVPEWMCGNDDAIVYSVRHWISSKNHNQNATYVNTSHGTFLINDMSHFCKDKDIGVIDSINMEKILPLVAKKANIPYTTYDNLCIQLPKTLKKQNKK